MELVNTRNLSMTCVHLKWCHILRNIFAPRTHQSRGNTRLQINITHNTFSSTTFVFSIYQLQHPRLLVGTCICPALSQRARIEALYVSQRRLGTAAPPALRALFLQVGSVVLPRVLNINAPTSATRPSKLRSGVKSQRKNKMLQYWNWEVLTRLTFVLGNIYVFMCINVQWVYEYYKHLDWTLQRTILFVCFGYYCL